MERAFRRLRRGILGLDPRKVYLLERRVAAAERQVKELQARLDLLDRDRLLARECARSIEHLLHEGVRARRDIDSLLEPGDE
jgi:hypothetical protein